MMSFAARERDTMPQGNLCLMAGQTGFEPAIFSVTGRRKLQAFLLAPKHEHAPVYTKESLLEIQPFTLKEKAIIHIFVKIQK